MFGTVSNEQHFNYVFNYKNKIRNMILYEIKYIKDQLNQLIIKHFEYALHRIIIFTKWVAGPTSLNPNILSILADFSFFMLLIVISVHQDMLRNIECEAGDLLKTANAELIIR